MQTRTLILGSVFTALILAAPIYGPLVGKIFIDRVSAALDARLKPGISIDAPPPLPSTEKQPIGDE